MGSVSVATGQDQHVEDEEVELRAGRMVLQGVERRLAGFIEGDDFAVDRFVRKRQKSFCDRRIAQ
jgi:hypothetical protein